MKLNFLKSVVFFSLSLASATLASAETVHANIPFSFFANGKPLPAGDYSVRTLPGSPSILLFENEATGEKALAFARTVTGTPGNTALAFTIRTADRAYEVSIAPSRGIAKTTVALTLAK